jgi:hypothetical protein
MVAGATIYTSSYCARYDIPTASWVEEQITRLSPPASALDVRELSPHDGNRRSRCGGAPLTGIVLSAASGTTTRREAPLQLRVCVGGEGVLVAASNERPRRPATEQSEGAQLGAPPERVCGRRGLPHRPHIATQVEAPRPRRVSKLAATAATSPKAARRP